MRQIAAHYIFHDRKLIRSGVLTVDNDGTILDIEADALADSRAGVEFHNGILIPGMVNAHTHLELSMLKGAIPPGCGFTGFGRAMGTLRQDFTLEHKIDSADFHDSRMFNEGISAVADICNDPRTTLDIKIASRIRYRSFIEVYGLRRQSLAGYPRLLEECRGSGEEFYLSPHSTYSLNTQLFQQTVDHEPDSPLSIHFMESGEETDLFRGMGAMKEWIEGEGMTTDFACRYRDPAERVITQVPTGRNVLLVHNTYTTPEIIDMLKEHFGAKLAFVICPRSNLYITGQLPPVRSLARSGCRIAFGTDSLASNHDLSLIRELAVLKDMELTDLLYWATAGGAEALGYSDVFGTFDKGKKPGVVLLEGVDLVRMRLTGRSQTRRLV